MGVNQGQPEECAALLTEALAEAVEGGLSPLHHRALEAHCCLTSALRVISKQQQQKVQLAKEQGIQENHRAPSSDVHPVQGASPTKACAGVDAARTLGLQAAAAAHALVLAAALQQVLDSGRHTISP